jgi:hypothetical protein
MNTITKIFLNLLFLINAISYPTLLWGQDQLKLEEVIARQLIEMGKIRQLADRQQKLNDKELEQPVKKSIGILNLEKAFMSIEDQVQAKQAGRLRDNENQPASRDKIKKRSRDHSEEIEIKALRRQRLKPASEK